MKDRNIATQAPRKRKEIPGLLLFVFSTVCLALTGTALADDPFFMGWYTGVYYDDPSAEIVSIGGSRALYYHMGYLTDAKVQSRLDDAYANGLEVIMNVDGIDQVGSDVVAVDAARVTQFVNTFKNHPAVVGWYTADEPSGTAQRDLCQIAYDAVKAADTTNPVYLCTNHSDQNTIGLFAPTYDVVIFDSYLFEQGDSDCYRVPDHGWWPLNFKEGLKSKLDEVSGRAAAANRPWVYAGQGFGRTDGYGTRMPTRYEHRWGTYYAFLKGASGILDWEYDCATRSVADAGDPYPYSGQQWFTDIYQPLGEEIAIIGDAMGEGEVAGGISDNEGDILSSVYQDPVTGRSYMLALNASGSGHNPMFSVNLPGQANWVQAHRMDKGYTIALSGEQVTEYISPWEVATYELIMDNVAPVAANDSYGVAEDNVLQVLPSGVLANDSDVNPGDILTAIKTSETAHGSVTLNSDGSLSYTPHDDWHGTDTFTYKANDGALDSNTATVSVTVDPVPDLALVDNGTPGTGLHSYTLTATNLGIVTLSKFTIDSEVHQVFDGENHSEWLGDNSASTSETTDSYVIFGDLRLPDLGGETWPGPGDPPDHVTEETIADGGTGMGTLNNYDEGLDIWDAYMKLGPPSTIEEAVDLMQLVTLDGRGFTVTLTLVIATDYDR